MKFPKIMGVVNCTPDSFSDGGQFKNAGDAIEHALRLIDEGADVLDIGGESTRPGAQHVPVDEETHRVVPVIDGIRKRNTIVGISVDTTKALVALEAIQAGATMINDVSAGMADNMMFEVAAKHNVPIVLMHMQGTPQTMQDNPDYKDVVKEVARFLTERRSEAKEFYNRHSGGNDVVVYVDPGIGFGKTLDHNLTLLKSIETFAEIAPVVLGISRKRFLGTLTNIDDPAERDTATALLHAVLIHSPIEIIRVHNVQMLSMLRTLASPFL